MTKFRLIPCERGRMDDRRIILPYLVCKMVLASCMVSLAQRSSHTPRHKFACDIRHAVQSLVLMN